VGHSRAVAACRMVDLLGRNVARSQSPSPEEVTAPMNEAALSEAPAAARDDSLTTMFRHAKWDRFWLSGQANWISQYHPSFHSPYQGTNSLTPEAEAATSRVLTLFTGWRPTNSTEFLCDVQETGGAGLGRALGVAGFFNLDVVRNPTLSKAPYIARLMWHQIIPLSRKKVVAERNPLSLFRELPERRLELRSGKFSMADFFDLNTYGTDTNFQFMNWTVDNNGAYDYAADTRGFTFAAMLEYHERFYTVRFAEALMPKVANGIQLEADLSLARAENIEVGATRQRFRQATGYPENSKLCESRQHGSLQDAGGRMAGEPGNTRPANYRASAADHDQVRIRTELRAVHPGLDRRVRPVGLERRAARIVCLYRSEPDLGVRRRSKWTAVGSEERPAGAGVCEQWNQPRACQVLGLWRVGVLAGRWKIALWAGKHSGELLHAARVAGFFSGRGPAIYVESRL